MALPAPIEPTQNMVLQVALRQKFLIYEARIPTNSWVFHTRGSERCFENSERILTWFVGYRRMLIQLREKAALAIEACRLLRDSRPDARRRQPLIPLARSVPSWIALRLLSKFLLKMERAPRVQAPLPVKRFARHQTGCARIISSSCRCPPSQVPEELAYFRGVRSPTDEDRGPGLSGWWGPPASSPPDW
jgi:hypothetical protein